MFRSIVLVLVAAAATAAPVTLDTALDGDTLSLEIRLAEPLPENLETALPSGAKVAVTYLIRVRSARKVWWDKKVWRGDAVASAIFDPVTGRYRCELVLDGVVVSSREAESTDEARKWLKAPDTVRFAMPEDLKRISLRVRVRAVFASSTKWLFFPDVDGTKWVEVPIAIPETEAAATAAER
jgi:hypothetical protein